jgi:hypothetical protein
MLLRALSCRTRGWQNVWTLVLALGDKDLGVQEEGKIPMSDPVPP